MVCQLYGLANRLCTVLLTGGLDRVYKAIPAAALVGNQLVHSGNNSIPVLYSPCGLGGHSFGQQMVHKKKASTTIISRRPGIAYVSFQKPPLFTGAALALPAPVKGNMNKLIVAILLIANLFAGTAVASGNCATELCEEAQTISPLPADVKTFVERRDGCDHFRGEPWDNGDEPEIKERREFIFQNINKLCNGTDIQLKELRDKYRDNTVVFNFLGKYENRIEMK